MRVYNYFQLNLNRELRTFNLFLLRRMLRRQSARYNSQANKPTENLFEIGDVNYLVPSSSIKKEENGENCTPARSQRTSLGRPLRKAAEKVQSYKEIPLNIKMRRSE